MDCRVEPGNDRGEKPSGSQRKLALILSSADCPGQSSGALSVLSGRRDIW